MARERAERAPALPATTTQAHGDSSHFRVGSEISLALGHFCQAALPADMPSRKATCAHRGKRGPNRRRKLKLEQLFPTRRAALSPSPSSQGLALVPRPSEQPRQRSPPAPAVAPALAPSPPVLPPRSPPRGARPPAPAPGEAPPDGVRAAARIRSPASRPTCPESVGRLVQGSPRRGDPRALEAPGAPLPVPELAPERPYLYSRSLTWSDR